MASTQQDVDYMTKHLSYEISMMQYALEMLVGCQPERRASMYFECFAVHLRNLKAFLIDRKGTNYKALDFNKKFRTNITSTEGKKAHMLAVRLDNRVFHLSKTDRETQRITVAHAITMYEWVTRELERFGRELPREYEIAWRGVYTGRKLAVKPVQASTQATNHLFSNTATFSPASAMSGVSVTLDGKFVYDVK